jgi:DNA-binding beta-propeller fold protein YncE
MDWIDWLTWRVLAAMLAVAALAGCTSAPVDKKPAAPAMVFYPEAPEPPRVQHLATFTGERDFAPDRSGFATFIAGQAKGQQMQQIYGVALFDGRLYVVDTKGASIAIFDLVNRKYSVFSGAGSGRMKSPINLTIDADGTKYVTDTGLDQILVYDRDNRFQGAYGDAGQFKPVATAIVGERLYVVDIQHHEVQVLDKRTGRLLSRFGKPGSKEGELFHPTNIAIGPTGDVFITETSNFRVQRFSADGKSLRVYGEVGDRPGNFARPKGLAIDRAGRIYVSDAAFQNVQVFEGDGRLLMAFGQPKEGEGLSLPAGVAIDYDHVALFKRYADPKFDIEYLIVVASQIAPNKVDVFGFGRMSGVDYNRAAPAAKR